MIDTNVYVGAWPFRKLPAEQPRDLPALLERAGITEAWVSSFEGLFQRDVAGVNARLACGCQEAGSDRLIPLGTINPVLPDWEDDLRRCQEEHGFRGIRLHPGFHGYTLADPAFARLLELAAAKGVLVQIVATMEDERTQHPVFRVPEVNFKPLLPLLTKFPELRLMLLNAFRKLPLEEAAQLAAAGRVCFDIATLEGVDRVSALADKVGPQRIVLGSNFPLFYFESTHLKLRETEIPAGIVHNIREENARRMLPLRHGAGASGTSPK